MKPTGRAKELQSLRLRKQEVDAAVKALEALEILRKGPARAGGRHYCHLRNGGSVTQPRTRDARPGGGVPVEGTVEHLTAWPEFEVGGFSDGIPHED
jgi:hypothetical protein